MKLFLALFLLVISSGFFSQPLFAAIYIVYPEKLSHYKTLSNNLLQHLEKSGHTSIKVISSNKADNYSFYDTDLMILVGKDLKESYQYQKSISTPKIFSFITRKAIDYNKIEKTDTVISTQQPIEKLIQTANIISEKNYKKTILFIISSEDKDTKSTLSEKKNSNIKIITVNENEKAAKIIDDELSTTAVIVAIPSKRIWSGNSARWILQQAYSHKVPIIGYSKTFLKAGAMLSIYSSAEQIFDAIENNVSQWEKGEDFENRIVFPQHNIDINKNIAKSLNFNQNDFEKIGFKK